jgi:hypothetical protein
MRSTLTPEGAIPALVYERALLADRAASLSFALENHRDVQSLRDDLAAAEEDLRQVRVEKRHEEYRAELARSRMKDLQKTAEGRRLVLDRQIKELTERLEKAEGGLRTRTLADTIRDKGLNPKVASIVPQNLTTPEEVEAWLNDYADVFGASAPTPDGTAPPAEDTAPNPQFDALQRIQNTQAGGQPFSGDEAQMLALINSTTDPGALNQLLFGNVNGPQVI